MKAKRSKTTYCVTFQAWKSGDDKAFDNLLKQGYDRLFMPKAERIASRVSVDTPLDPRKLLRAAWSNLGNMRKSDEMASFSHFLLHLNKELECLGSSQCQSLQVVYQR